MLADFACAGKRKKSFGALRIRGHLARFLQPAIERRRERIDGAHGLADMTTFQRVFHIRQYGHERVRWSWLCGGVDCSIWAWGETGRVRGVQSRLRDRANHPNSGKGQPERKHSEQNPEKCTSNSPNQSDDRR